MKHVIASIALALTATATPLAAADTVSGRWVTEDEGAVVEIGRCGSTVCGRIVKFLKPPAQGDNQRDVNNPDRSKRDRKLLGTQVLSNFVKDDGKWKGKVYDPKNGKTYSSSMRLLSATRLQVKGCVGPFCRSQTWTRAR